MSVQLRRSISVLASMSFLGLALSSATGCGAAAVVGSPNVASALGGTASVVGAATPDDSVAVASTEPAPRDVTGQTVEGTKLEIAGIQALVDQEKRSLAAPGLSAQDRAEHRSTLAKLIKMKGDSEADLLALERPSVSAANPVAVASRARLGASFADAGVPGSAKLSNAIVPAPARLGHLPGGLGSALGGATAFAGAARDPKGAAMGLAKMGASRIPGGSSLLGAAGSVANLAHDPKGAAMDLAKQGASHIPGGASVLGAASGIAGLTHDPKAAAKDLAKQGVMTAANKLPIPGGLKSSFFGGGGLTK